MFLVSHLSGNANVRAVLTALQARELLYRFVAGFALSNDEALLRVLPSKLAQQLRRRACGVTRERLVRFPQREIVRVLSNNFGWSWLTSDGHWASVNVICQDLDRRCAQIVLKSYGDVLKGVYCYEDVALTTFKAAKSRGLVCVYDLPIAYWEVSERILRGELIRYPEWAQTLQSNYDSTEMRERKSEELLLADLVITPSRFVYESLPEKIRSEKACHVVPFGSPVQPTDISNFNRSSSKSLKVLFVGSMTQRKGLADLFEAMRLLGRKDVELTVLGSLAAPLEFYRTQYPHFHYESPRSHTEVLELMHQHDVFVLPSLSEGRALVQQEALACGLPLIVTPNAGGEDLIVEGETGFIVPIRSPEAIAQKLSWFAENQAELPQMREAAIRKAAEYSWETYGKQIAQIVAASITR